MKNILISIIVPVFNIETYISECIESIQKQTYRNLQIILVDDGSTDRSGIMCDNYALKDSRIEVLHQRNKGPVAARKNGLDKAKGKYVGFVDGDDYIEPDMYEMLIHEIEKSKADFVHSGYWEGNAKKIIFSNEIINLQNNKAAIFEKVVLKSFITPSNWSKLYSVELIKKAYDSLKDDCILGEDLLALCICILECNKISIIGGCYYHYRVREGSLSHKNDIRDLKKVYKIYEELCNILECYGLHKELESVMDKFLWNNVMTYMARINQNDFQIAKFYFKDVEKLCDKKVVIYGAGAVGRDYYAQICRYSDCEVAVWVDSYPERYQYKHINLYGMDVLDSIKFDILIIAVLRETVADDICNELIKRGINEEKIYWSEPERWGIE
ncbi:MAG: glycosyltransferase [Dorea sp.]|nr:glycosyltransferase [Dorea sp.]